MIDVSRHGRVTVLTLARPDKHNALNIELCDLIRDSVETASDARAIVITGRGPSFCSGADLDEVYTTEFRDHLYSMLHAVTEKPVPVIAAVSGAAIGAGTQLAIAADFRMIAPTARFSIPTARIGLAVDPWTIRRLALLAGNGAARKMLLSCERIDANDALACGLADRRGTPVDAISWAETMTKLAPLTVAYSKHAINTVFEPELEPDVAATLDRAFEACWASDDFAEGRRSRAETRDPIFKGT